MKEKPMLRAITKMPGVKTRRYRKLSTRCYEIAFRFVMDNQEWILVHGVLDVSEWLGAENKYKHYEHAWAENGEYIFEPLKNAFFRKERYEQAFSAKTMKRYTASEAAKEALSGKPVHYGPWHEG